MSLLNTVFAKQQQLRQMEQQRLQFEQQQKQLQQQQMQEHVFREQERADKNREAEFQRQYKIAELQGKYLGMLGQQTPKFTNPALQEYAEASYLGGMAERQGQLDKFALEDMEQGGANSRNLMTNQVRMQIADQNRGQKQVFHDEDMFWKGKLFNQDQAQFDEMMRWRWSRPVGGSMGPALGANPFFAVEDKLRGQVEKHPIHKGFNIVSSQIGSIMNAPSDGSGDLALLFGYMKMLDPNSVVHPSEYANAENVRAKFDEVSRLYHNWKEGDKLLDSQRYMFRQAAQRLYQVQKRQYENFTSNYKRIASEAGANPNNVVFPNLGYQTSGAVGDDTEEDDPMADEIVNGFFGGQK